MACIALIITSHACTGAGASFFMEVAHLHGSLPNQCPSLYQQPIILTSIYLTSMRLGHRIHWRHHLPAVVRLCEKKSKDTRQANRKEIDMLSNKKKVIAVIGATGHQGGAVLRALQAGGLFRVRALTRNPGKHRELADEVVEADLNRPDTLQPAFAGAHGVFLVTSSWLEGTDEFAQGTAAVRAAKAAGVEHFIWSTLPDVEAISGGQFDVPHFTGK